MINIVAEFLYATGANQTAHMKKNQDCFGDILAAGALGFPQA